MSPDSRWTRRLSSAQVPGGIYTIFIPGIWCQFLFKMTTKSLCMTLMGPGRRVDVSEHTYELRQSVGATTVVTTSLHGTYSISWYLVSIFINNTTIYVLKRVSRKIIERAFSHGTLWRSDQVISLSLCLSLSGARMPSTLCQVYAPWVYTKDIT